MALDEDKKPIAFTRKDGMRIRESVRAYERLYRNAPTGKRGQAANSTPLVAAKSTSTITAASGDTPGTGTIEYYSVPETGAATATGVTVTVRNWGGSIASGRMLLVGTGPWGPWVVVDKC
jgi:hypothetical protein